MTREEYLKQRNDLIKQAQNCINSGEHQKSTEIQNEIKELDEKMEKISEAQANLNSLNASNNIVDLGNVQNIVPIGGGIDPLNLSSNIDNKVLIDDEALNKQNEIEYVNAWAKDMMNKPLTESEQAIFDAKNAFTHTTENTGIVIPTTVVAGIFKEVEDQHPLWNDVFKTYIKGNVKLLKSTSSSDAKWYDEATPTEDGKEEFAEAMLTGCELARDITVSWLLREMSIEEFIPFIQSQLAQKIGEALGYGVAAGKGKPGDSDQFKPEPRGIITALKAESGKPQVIEYDESDPLDYKKCTKLMSLIKSAYKKGAYIYAENTTIWNELANIVDKNGRPYFVPDPTNEGAGRILGVVVKEEGSIPVGDILLGNALQGYHANVNKQVTLDSEDRKKQRETDYLAYGIVDGDVRTTKAFALITKKTV